MREDVAAVTKQCTETVLYGKKVALVVKEWSSSADKIDLVDEDFNWRLLVRCVFHEDDGQRAFSEADIPALKAKSSFVTSPLMNAVMRVNGFNLEAEAKNSEAVQG